MIIGALAVRDVKESFVISGASGPIPGHVDKRPIYGHAAASSPFSSQGEVEVRHARPIIAFYFWRTLRL
jgi:hypothetical protein